MLAPCTDTSDPTADVCRPTGATLMPVPPRDTPVTPYEMRHGLNSTPVRPREMPVMERAIAAASFANLEGCATLLPVTSMLYLLSLALSWSIISASLAPSLSANALRAAVVLLSLGSADGSQSSLPVALSLASTASPHCLTGSSGKGEGGGERRKRVSKKRDRAKKMTETPPQNKKTPPPQQNSLTLRQVFAAQLGQRLGRQPLPLGRVAVLGGGQQGDRLDVRVRLVVQRGHRLHGLLHPALPHQHDRRDQLGEVGVVGGLADEGGVGGAELGGGGERPAGLGGREGGGQGGDRQDEGGAHCAGRSRVS